MGISRCAVCELLRALPHPVSHGSAQPSPAQPASSLLFKSRAPGSRRSGHSPILQIAESPVRPVQRSSLSPIRVKWACSY